LEAEEVKEPIEVKVQTEGGVTTGYVRYLALGDGEKVARKVDVLEDGSVAADLSPLGTVCGIELIGLGEKQLEAARSYAESEGLAFPRLLAGVLAPNAENGHGGYEIGDVVFVDAPDVGARARAVVIDYSTWIDAPTPEERKQARIAFVGDRDNRPISFSVSKLRRSPRMKARA
jgi:hypothetical protein